MTIECRTETPGEARQVITIDAHTLFVDMSRAAGGGGSAPGAHDLFDASLAACKALTAVVYARARNMSLDRVIVKVNRDDTEERQGRYVLTVSIDFEGGLTDEERTKLHGVLDRCPVHKLMTKTTVEIVTLPLSPADG
jgi:putative redox protein